MWYKNNKAAEKWTEEEVEAVFEKTYQWLKNNEKVNLIMEVDLYMMENHSVCDDTRKSWINNLYINNKCINGLWKSIQKLIEVRLVKDKELRSNIQGMVLQNKHNYREKQDIKESLVVQEMGTVKVNGKDFKADIG